MATNREKLIEILTERYPKMWMRPSEQQGFAPGNIVSGENAFDEDGIELFDYYNEDRTETMYVMGVRKSLHDLLEQHGWYCECHDPGTYIITQE